MDSKEFRKLILAIIENKDNAVTYGPLLVALVEELKRRNSEAAKYLREAQKQTGELEDEFRQLGAHISWEDTPFTRMNKLYRWTDMAEYCESAYERIKDVQAEIERFNEQLEFKNNLRDIYLRDIE